MQFQGSKQAVLQAIEAADNIFIFHHTNPDGDCLGAQFGLKELIKLNFPTKKVFCIGSSYNLFSFLNFAMDDFELLDLELVKHNSLAILVDGNYLKRIEAADILVNQPFSNKLRIDHHPVGSDVDFNFVYVDASKAACCEQIANLAQEANWQINTAAAEYLTLGIYTDTGRFNFENVSPITYGVMAWMMEQTELNYFQMTRQLMERSMKEIHFRAHILNHFHLKNQVAWFVVTKTICKQFGLNEHESSEVNAIANVGDCKVWIFFVEKADGSYRARFRSNSVNVNLLANQFNGGGHNLAAGAVIAHNQIDEVLNAAWKAVYEFK